MDIFAILSQYEGRHPSFLTSHAYGLACIWNCWSYMTCIVTRKMMQKQRNRYKIVVTVVYCDIPAVTMPGRYGYRDKKQEINS